jgi:hypothetical protein
VAIQPPPASENTLDFFGPARTLIRNSELLRTAKRANRAQFNVASDRRRMIVQTFADDVKSQLPVFELPRDSS